MTVESKEMVTIPKKVYNRLMKDVFWLNCLEDAGVDNWSGYNYACELYAEHEERNED